MISPPHAVIYVRDSPDVRRDAGRCLDHCNDRGWTVAAVVVDRTGGGAELTDAYRMLAAGEADTIVVADATHLRAVVATPTSGPIPSQRRARPTV